MKRILKNVIVSSVLTLVMYLLFAVVLLGWIENKELRFLAKWCILYRKF